MTTWNGTTCQYCEGTMIVEQRVDLHRKVEGHHVLIEHVPAGVCQACGARFYTPQVVQMIEAMIRGRDTSRHTTTVAVYTFIAPMAPSLHQLEPGYYEATATEETTG